MKLLRSENLYSGIRLGNLEGNLAVYGPWTPAAESGIGVYTLAPIIASVLLQDLEAVKPSRCRSLRVIVKEVHSFAWIAALQRASCIYVCNPRQNICQCISS